MNLTLVDTANRISGRVVNHTCPACNTERRWTYPDNEAIAVCWARNVGGQITLTGEMFLGIGFTCERCGYVRLHLPPADL